MPDARSTLRQRVEISAQRAGIHLATLARIVGIRPPSLHKALNLNRGTYAHLPRMAEVLNVPLAWLRSGDPTVTPAWAVQALGSSAPPTLPPEVRADLVRAKMTLLHDALTQAQRLRAEATAETQTAATHRLAAAFADLAAFKRYLDAGDIDAALAVTAADESCPCDASRAELERLRTENRALHSHVAAGETLPPMPQVQAG